MGCVFGRQISSSGPPDGEVVVGKGREKGLERDLAVPSGRTEKVGVAGGGAGGGGGGSEVQNGGDQVEEKKDGSTRSRGERRRSRPNPRLSNPSKHIHGEQVAAGWPSWLSAVAGEAINGWIPRRADTFEKIDKIGQGTYSNVYKARDSMTGKIVALKKVRFDNLEPESVKFMAREILVLRRLDHPNVVKLHGLVTSRMSCSLYLVFDYMDHDLAGLAASPGIKFTEPQVKCFMHQLLSGLEHCHIRRVLHRDIKGSNLLIDSGGVLKIADFGLASFFDPNHKQPMTSRVVTLWYRPPELLLGATDYGVGVDLWSTGCILAELLAGKPIMPGRTEVEQLHKIFKLCGSPSEDYWKKSKLPHATIFKPQHTYKRCIAESFKDFPPSSLPLIETLLAIDPAERQTATAALNSQFFTTKPYACEPSNLPKYPPSKEMDAKRRDEESRRLRAAGRSNVDGTRKARTRDRAVRAIPAPEANAELQVNIDRRRLISNANAKSKSEKFPPPHQDGTLGYTLGTSHHMDSAFDPPDVPFSSMNFSYAKEPIQTWSGPLVDPATVDSVRRKSKQQSKKNSVSKKTKKECNIGLVLTLEQTTNMMQALHTSVLSLCWEVVKLHSKSESRMRPPGGGWGPGPGRGSPAPFSGPGPFPVVFLVVYATLSLLGMVPRNVLGNSFLLSLYASLYLMCCCWLLQDCFGIGSPPASTGPPMDQPSLPVLLPPPAGPPPPGPPFGPPVFPGPPIGPPGPGAPGVGPPAGPPPPP